jgi:hypothetical protein
MNILCVSVCVCRADENGTTCANRRTYILYYKMKRNKIQREREALLGSFLNAQAVLCCETNAVALYRRYPSLISNSSRKATSPSQRLSSKHFTSSLPSSISFFPSFKNPLLVHPLLLRRVSSCCSSPFYSALSVGSWPNPLYTFWTYR